MRFLHLALLSALLWSPISSHAGTAQPLEQEEATRALAFLLRNLDSVQPTGDVQEGESLALILARELSSGEGIVLQTNSCAQGAGEQDRLIFCTLVINRQVQNLGSAYLNIDYTLSVEDDGTLSGLLDVYVGRGT